MTQLRTFLLPCLALILAGCASQQPATRQAPAVPRPAPLPAEGRDGPEAVIPSGLSETPDAQPRLEPIRKGGPNKPYEALGQRYEPQTDDAPLKERGLASWYGKKFHGRPTSSGEVYNMYAMTGAHATMPIPSYARVRNPANGREVILRINDRGPFHPGRIIDLSYTAALKLDVLRGVAPVEVERITYEDIRTGAWQRGKGATPDSAPATPVYAAAPTAGAAQQESTQTLAELPADLRPGSVGSTGSVASVAAEPIPLRSASVEPSVKPMPLARASAPGFWIQLGAFSKLDGAEQFRQKLVQQLDSLAPLLAIFRDSGLHRLQAGPYASREDARQAAERVRLAIALTPMVVERR